MTFKLTYSTMFDPPEEMHSRFETALDEVRKGCGATHALSVDGRDVASARSWEKRSPVDQRVVLGRFALADAEDVDRAVAAAKRAFDGWRATPAAERVRLVKRVAALLEERVFTIGAVVALEVGKNRMEALGETQETADFFSGYAAEVERNQAYDHVLPDDPLPGFRSHNRSIMKPHGVWGVITPFNFPLALAGGPVAAALVTGNTVVFKGATDTPWSGHLLAECLRDAGLPAGVFNYVTGSGPVVGEALASHPDLAGLTFTGSHEVGMSLYRRMASGPYPRPCIAEMGGKNPCVVTARGDLERAATGIVRSAYGLTGQKCSALSRVYVEGDVADALLAKVVEKTEAIRVGDPCVRENWMGPVINGAAAESYERYCGQLRRDGARILVGGTRLTDGALAHGFFVAPTVAEAPPDHPLFREEMFQPIVMVARVKDLREGMAHANDTTLGLTAGCYGDDEDARYFLDHTEAGVTYVNRPQGATTGAWPGYQPFGGWKGSGSTGKAIGSVYYLPLYLREQSQTVVE
ncbi:MAG: aldehyde dehydrogenase family protein [Acidobacteria bacterium]|jgi:1-pyrroline-5-carboxylate dehydrogenase|nr:aldehyde dehydrogenase family protein [Acidobacteriota bacterium]